MPATFHPAPGTVTNHSLRHLLLELIQHLLWTQHRTLAESQLGKPCFISKSFALPRPIPCVNSCVMDQQSRRGTETNEIVAETSPRSPPTHTTSCHNKAVSILKMYCNGIDTQHTNSCTIGIRALSSPSATRYSFASIARSTTVSLYARLLQNKHKIRKQTEIQQQNI